MYPQCFSSKSRLFIHKCCSQDVTCWLATGQLTLPGQIQAPPVPEGALGVSRMTSSSGRFSRSRREIRKTLSSISLFSCKREEESRGPVLLPRMGNREKEAVCTSLYSCSFWKVPGNQLVVPLPFPFCSVGKPMAERPL